MRKELNKAQAIKELEFLMEGYRQLMDCKEPNPRYEDLYDACKMGRDALLSDDDLNDRDCINCDHYKDYKCGDNNIVKCCDCQKCQFAAKGGTHGK